MTSQSPSDRLNRASNDILEATSFLQGANAAFIESLYAQYQENPDAVDPTWRAYFASLSEQRLDADPARPRSGVAARRKARSGERRACRRADRTMAREGGREREGQPRRGARFHPRDPDGARLSRHRPSRGRTRSAASLAEDAASAARSGILRLPRCRPRPPGVRRRRAGPRNRHAAPNGGHPQAHLLRPHRLRVHAHQRCGAEGLAAAPHRRTRQGDFLHAGRQARDPEQADRGRRLREIRRPCASSAPSASASMAANPRSRRSNRSSSAAASSA